MSQVIDTGTDVLLAEISDDGVATITLNKPERRNALSEAMLGGLERTLLICEQDSRVQCVILTGAGGAFCAGGDVKDFAELGTPGMRAGENELPLHEEIEKHRRYQRATAGRLYAMPKPTIAAIDGPAAGAGLGLALACDLRVASEASFLVTSFARVGLSGDYGVTWFLTRDLGKARALELLLLSERVPADRAHSLGLVNWTVPNGGALTRAQEIASGLASGLTIAHRAIKDNVNRAVDGDLLTCMDLEVTEAMRCAATKDHVDAVLAFAAKRG